MGCAGAREKIEDRMMLVKLERMEVQMEKEKELKKLSELEGHSVKRSQIPDYIDPKFAKEKQIYDDDEEDEAISKKSTVDKKKQKGKRERNQKLKSKKEKEGKNKKVNKDDDKKKKKKKQIFSS